MVADFTEDKRDALKAARKAQRLAFFRTTKVRDTGLSD